MVPRMCSILLASYVVGGACQIVHQGPAQARIVQAGWCIVSEMAMVAPPIASPVLGVSLRIAQLNGITAPPIASPVLGVSLRIAQLNGITVRYAEAGCPTNPMVLFW
jgi:hypothetical protein